MSTFPLPVLEGEKILKEDDKALFIKNALGIGYNILYGKLWLTSARLVHQDFPLGRLTTYPLCHITQAVRESVNVAQKKFEIKGVYTSWTNFNVALSLTFDNGGLEYFIPQDIDGWAQAVTQAKSNAPTLEYTHTPPVRPSLAADPQTASPAARSSARLIWVFIGIVFLFVCAVTACVAVPFVMAILGGGSSG
jgi:hypothetical protein